MKVKKLATALIAVLTLTVAGCAGDSGSGSGSNTEADPAAAGSSVADTDSSAAAPESSTESSTESSAETSSAAAFPVQIRSALGTTTIEQAPQRVVTIGWGSQDAAIALGVTPVGMQDFTGDSGTDDGILPWDAEKLNGAKPTIIKATSDEVPYETILSLKPDVILAVNSGLTAEQYQRLTTIAPTVAYPGKPWLTSWQDQIQLVGQALGKSDEAAKLQAATEKSITDAAAAHPEFKAKTVAFGSGTESGKFNFYVNNDSRVELLKTLGFTPIEQLSKLDDPAAFSQSVSLEKVADYPSQVLVAWYLSDQIKSSTESNALFTALPAVKSDSYVALTDPPMVLATSAPTVLSLPWMLEKFLPELSTAAKNAQ